MDLEGNSNAGTSAAFLKQLRERHRGRLHVIRDKAPARCGEAMREYMRTPGLGLRLVNPRFHEGRLCRATARTEAPMRPSGAGRERKSPGTCAWEPRPWYRRGSGISSAGCPSGKTRSRAAAAPSCNQGPKDFCENPSPITDVLQMHIPPWLWLWISCSNGGLRGGRPAVGGLPQDGDGSRLTAEQCPDAVVLGVEHVARGLPVPVGYGGVPTPVKQQADNASLALRAQGAPPLARNEAQGTCLRRRPSPPRLLRRPAATPPRVPDAFRRPVGGVWEASGFRGSHVGGGQQGWPLSSCFYADWSSLAGPMATMTHVGMEKANVNRHRRRTLLTSMYVLLHGWYLVQSSMAILVTRKMAIAGMGADMTMKRSCTSSPNLRPQSRSERLVRVVAAQMMMVGNRM